MSALRNRHIETAIGYVTGRILRRAVDRGQAGWESGTGDRGAGHNRVSRTNCVSGGGAVSDDRASRNCLRHREVRRQVQHWCSGVLHFNGEGVVARVARRVGGRAVDGGGAKREGGAGGREAGNARVGRGNRVGGGGDEGDNSAGRAGGLHRHVAWNGDDRCGGVSESRRDGVIRSDVVKRVTADHAL